MLPSGNSSSTVAYNTSGDWSSSRKTLVTYLGSFLPKCVLVGLISSAFASMESTCTVTSSFSYSEKSAPLLSESAITS